MGRNREPIKLIEAKGRAHLGKAEIERREKTEVPIISDDIKAPDFLAPEEEKKFYQIADKLKQIGIMSDLDCDVLGRYVKASGDWLAYSQLVRKTQAKLQSALSADEDDDIFTYTELLGKYETLKTKAFNQCHTCASALGMTITSRCKIVVPELPEEKPPNKFLKFGAGGE